MCDYGRAGPQQGKRNRRASCCRDHNQIAKFCKNTVRGSKVHVSLVEIYAWRSTAVGSFGLTTVIFFVDVEIFKHLFQRHLGTTPTKY